MRIKKFNLLKYDVVYLSYDEPNADNNWRDLLSKIPYAKRIHGIKGSDTAHKAVANLASTDRVIVIDGDNIVQHDFINQLITLDESVDEHSTVFSWPSLNVVNGLLYGNGGIKCWPRQAMLDMRTHEIADADNPTTQVDFCWALNYMPIDKCFSKTYNNITKLQAWRAGFREGVKMSLDQGKKITDLSLLDIGNLNRLKIWMTIGLDVDNGIWAILGARHGCYLTQFTEWDYTQVIDFDYLNTLYDEDVNSMTEDNAIREIRELGTIISTQLPICSPYNAEQSLFFKNFNFNTNRQPKTIHSIDSINECEYREANNSTVEIFNGLELLYPENAEVSQLKRTVYQVGILFRTLYQYPESGKGLVDAYSMGQINSKIWLIENLPDNLGLVFICAGWYGTLASFMFEQCKTKFDKIRSFDVDLSCARIADSLNKPWVMDGWKFKASTLDIHDMTYPTEYTTIRSNGTSQTLVDMPDTIINTSCEHIENFESWYSKIPNGKIVVLQTNNYSELKEHINCSTSLIEFAKQTPMSHVFYEGELCLKDYTRYMRIGTK